MSVTTRQLGFIFWFLLSWLLLLLLGESYLSYVLLGLTSLGMLGWSFVLRAERTEVDLSRSKVSFWLFWLLLGLMLSLGISSFFTTLWPLTLYNLARYFFALSSFWFFLTLPEGSLPPRVWGWSLLGLGLIMSLLSLFFRFLPSLAQLLPGMNLLYSTYGHNHLVALLLLILPLSWWVVVDYLGSRLNQSELEHGKSKPSRFELLILLLPLSLTLALLTSFGRVGVMIGLLQFIWVYRQLGLDLNSKLGSTWAQQWRQGLRGLLKLVLGLFVLVLLVKVAFSGITLIKPDFACPVPSLEKQLCKPITTEARPGYWAQALKMIQARPLTGFGPGTFGVAAKRFIFNPGSTSAYAHNAFLQNLAEWGLIGGGLFMALMLTLLWQTKSFKWGFANAVWLGVSGIYLDVLFDFDWDFVGILSLSLILLAVLLRKKKLIKFLSKGQQPDQQKSPLQLIKVLFYLINLSLIVVASLYLYAEVLIRRGQAGQAFSTFPYFHWHRKIYESEAVLTPVQRQKFAHIYQNQGAVYPYLIKQADGPEQKQALREKLFELEPWLTATTEDDLAQIVSFYLQRQDFAQAEKYLNKTWAMFDQVRQETDYDPPYPKQLALIEQSLNLAQELMETQKEKQAFIWLERIITQEQISWPQQQRAAALLIELGNQVVSENLELTIRAYELAQTHIEWVLSQHPLWFEEIVWQDLSSETLLEYVEQTSDWSEEKIGWKDQTQVQIQRFVLATALEEQDWALVNRLLEFKFWAPHNYEDRHQLVIELSQRLDNLIEDKDYALARGLAQGLQNIMPHDYWVMMLPGSVEVLSGNLVEAATAYQVCNQDFIQIVPEEERHYECSEGLEKLERVRAGQLATTKLQEMTFERYAQVSQIIRGEATWEDFEY